MPINVGDISVSLTASTAQFQAEMSRAEQAANKATAGVQSSLAKLSGATSGLNNASGGAKRLTSDLHESNAALALVGEEFGVRIPRHIRTFISSLPGVSTAMSAAFSGLAIIGVVNVLIEAGKKVAELYQAFVKLREGPKRVAEAFKEINAPLEHSNDELQVTNDRLSNAIAKLQGKHQNTLKLALDEAILSADTLADSLDKDFKNFNKVFAENKVGLLGTLIGNAPTDDIADHIKKFGEDIGNITEEGNTRLRSMQSTGAFGIHIKVDPKSARAETAKEIQKRANDELIWLRDQLQQAERGIGSSFDLTGSGAGSFIADSSQRIQGLKDAIHHVQLQAGSVTKSGANSALEGEKAELEGNAVVKDPFQNAIKELQAQVIASKAELDAAGTSGPAEVLAKSFGEAQKKIASVNNELAEHHKALTLDQQVQILTLEDQDAWNKNEAETIKKLDNAKNSIDLRVKAQLALNAAIGQGTDAQRKAFVEDKVLSAVGVENYSNPQFMKDHAGLVGGIRSSAGQDFDATHAGKSQENIVGLQLEIDATKRLIAVQGESTAEIRRAEFANEEASLKAKGATQAEIEKRKELFEARNKEQDSATVAGINRQIEATQRLTTAQLGGVEAIRQAEIENIRNSGASQEIVDAKIRELNAQEQLQDLEKVRSLTHEKQLDDLRDELALLEKARETSSNKLAIDEAIKKVQQEIVAIEGQQVLVSGKAMDGIKQAMRELSLETKSVAQEVHDLFKDAFSGINDELSKLLTGQKTSWGEFFRGLAAQMLKTSLTNLEGSVFGKLSKPQQQQQQTGIDGGLAGVLLGKQTLPGISAPSQGGIGGVLSKVFGSIFGGAGGKRDGSSAATALFVQSAGGLSNLPSGLGIPGLGSGQTANGGFDLLPSLGGGGGVAGQLLGMLSFGGGLAGGGDVDPGHVFEVGEEGPELFAPRSAGTVIPHGQLTGNTYQYHIDARGTDPVLVEMRVKRAIALSHDSAIQKSGNVQQERARRLPQR